MLYVVRGDQSLRFVPSVWRTTDDDDGDDDIILRCVLMYCMYTFFLRKSRCCCCCCCRHRRRSSQQHSRVQDQTTCSRRIRIELRKCECAGCATVCVRPLLSLSLCVRVFVCILRTLNVVCRCHYHIRRGRGWSCIRHTCNRAVCGTERDATNHKMIIYRYMRTTYMQMWIGKRYAKVWKQW